jgi:hypothetical protein
MHHHAQLRYTFEEKTAMVKEVPRKRKNVKI